MIIESMAAVEISTGMERMKMAANQWRKRHNRGIMAVSRAGAAAANLSYQSWRKYQRRGIWRAGVIGGG